MTRISKIFKDDIKRGVIKINSDKLLLNYKGESIEHILYYAENILNDLIFENKMRDYIYKTLNDVTEDYVNENTQDVYDTILKCIPHDIIGELL